VLAVATLLGSEVESPPMVAPNRKTPASLNNPLLDTFIGSSFFLPLFTFQKKSRKADSLRAINVPWQKNLKPVRKKLVFIHGDISLAHFVIPGLTKPAPYLIRGNPVFSRIPAFAGMTCSIEINDAVHNMGLKS
jgi:hypothetical protein